MSLGHGRGQNSVDQKARAWLAASLSDIAKIIPVFPHTRGGEIAAELESGTRADDQPAGPFTNAERGPVTTYPPGF